jgi:hypothetical protein
MSNRTESAQLDQQHDWPGDHPRRASTSGWTRSITRTQRRQLCAVGVRAHLHELHQAGERQGRREPQDASGPPEDAGQAGQARHEHIANLCFRGAAKTTLFFEYLVLFLALYRLSAQLRHITGMIYVSDSHGQRRQVARKNIEFRYDNSEFLQEWIPEATSPTIISSSGNRTATLRRQDVRRQDRHPRNQDLRQAPEAWLCSMTWCRTTMPSPRPP